MVWYSSSLMLTKPRAKSRSNASNANETEEMKCTVARKPTYTHKYDSPIVLKHKRTNVRHSQT